MNEVAGQKVKAYEAFTKMKAEKEKEKEDEDNIKVIENRD